MFPSVSLWGGYAENQGDFPDKELRSVGGFLETINEFKVNDKKQFGVIQLEYRELIKQFAVKELGEEFVIDINNITEFTQPISVQCNALNDEVKVLIIPTV